MDVSSIPTKATRREAGTQSQGAPHGAGPAAKGECDGTQELSLGAALAVLSLSAAPAAAQVAAPQLPPVSGCQISALDADSVVVTGTVDPALGSRFQVEYGLLGLLNLKSLTLNVGSASDPTAVSTQLDGLVAGGATAAGSRRSMRPASRSRA